MNLTKGWHDEGPTLVLVFAREAAFTTARSLKLRRKAFSAREGEHLQESTLGSPHRPNFLCKISSRILSSFWSRLARYSATAGTPSPFFQSPQTIYSTRIPICAAPSSLPLVSVSLFPRTHWLPVHYHLIPLLPVFLPPSPSSCLSSSLHYLHSYLLSFKSFCLLYFLLLLCFFLFSSFLLVLPMFRPLSFLFVSSLSPPKLYFSSLLLLYSIVSLPHTAEVTYLPHTKHSTLHLQ